MQSDCVQETNYYYIPFQYGMYQLVAVTYSVSVASRALSCLQRDRLTVSAEVRLTSAGGRGRAAVGRLRRRVRGA